MEKKSIVSEIHIYNDRAELTQEERELLNRASLAREDAYAPYSHFKVGAAALLENDEVVIVDGDDPVRADDRATIIGLDPFQGVTG